MYRQQVSVCLYIACMYRYFHILYLEQDSFGLVHTPSRHPEILYANLSTPYNSSTRTIYLTVPQNIRKCNSCLPLCIFVFVSLLSKNHCYHLFFSLCGQGNHADKLQKHDVSLCTITIYIITMRTEFTVCVLGIKTP